MPIRQTIIAEARSWIGTPFRHQGRRKGQGVDCLGLLAGVAAALALKGRDGRPLASRDSLAYGHYPDETVLRQGLERCLIAVEDLSQWERSKSVQTISGEGVLNHPNPLPSRTASSPTSPSGRGVEGAIGLFRIDGSARHLAIFGQAEAGYPTLIHAYAPVRRVVEHRFDPLWQGRLVAVYQVPEQG